MAEKRRFLDVWIVESNTVYQEVPFEVVTDWVQQGRLLEDDQVKPSGTKDWRKIGGTEELLPYLPHAEPFQAEDQAEALEPVEVAMRWRHRPEDGDDDIDMIPLIDVSLVLLIFFMLTASSVGAAAFITTPQTEHGLLADNPSGLRIDIDWQDGEPVYAIAEGDGPPDPENKDLRNLKEVLERLRARLARMTEPTDLVINAHKDLKAKVARDLLVALGGDPLFRKMLRTNFFGVSEGQP